MQHAPQVAPASGSSEPEPKPESHRPNKAALTGLAIAHCQWQDFHRDGHTASGSACHITVTLPFITLQQLIAVTNIQADVIV